MKIEARGFGQVATGPVCKHLIRLFYMTESVKKQTGLADSNVKPLTVQQVGVLGAGTMGGGIAQSLADKGFKGTYERHQHKGFVIRSSGSFSNFGMLN